jgi:nucleoid-associated protein YgaU
MGLFDFVKNAGAKIFGQDEKPAVEVGTANDPATVAKAKELAARRRAAGLVQVIEKTGIKVSDLAVKVDGDTATVSGTAASQADREKVVLAVGNTHGIARVDDRIEVSNPEPEATFYTVKSGDSLSKIAKAHYGNAMKYPVIFEANKPLLSDPDKIYPGQVLRIPAIDG